MPAATFGIIVPIDLRLMAGIDVPPGNVVVALAFAVAAAMVAMGFSWKTP